MRTDAQGKRGTPPASPAGASPLLLWYGRPAAQWLEAQPIGNGRLGAMVFGGTQKETVPLNESTLWAGGLHDYDNPAISVHQSRRSESGYQQLARCLDSQLTDAAAIQRERLRIRGKMIAILMRC